MKRAEWLLVGLLLMSILVALGGVFVRPRLTEILAQLAGPAGASLLTPGGPGAQAVQDAAELQDDALISGMTHAKRIAQQLVVYGPTNAEDLRRLLSLGVGGLLLDRDHGPGLAAFRAYTGRVDALRPRPRPLIALDQEGGRVTRVVDDGLVTYATNALIGRQPRPSAKWVVADEGATFGAALRGAGIDVNLAPVADVASNTRSSIIAGFGRSYGPDSSVVATLTGIFAGALQKEGVAPTLKHFPGHGMVAEDSHHALPVANLGRAALEKHLQPYRQTFADPSIRQDMMLVMTAHVLYPALDPKQPASMSRAITTGLLRQELGFQGVIITDALGMGALKNGVKDRALGALKAGADLVLLDAGIGQAAGPVINAILAAYGDDATRWAENARSLKRILRLKRALHPAPEPSAARPPPEPPSP